MKKFMVGFLAFLIFFSTTLTTDTVLASELGVNLPSIQGKVNLEIPKELGITDEQINEILNMDSPEIYLVDGVAYDVDGNLIQVESKARGKLSWAVKAIRAAWNALPTKVKAAIGGVAGLETLLSVVDNFTGTVEDAVYTGCKAIGMSDSVAWWVTKTLMLAL